MGPAYFLLEQERTVLDVFLRPHLFPVRFQRRPPCPPPRSDFPITADNACRYAK